MWKYFQGLKINVKALKIIFIVLENIFNNSLKKK